MFPTARRILALALVVGMAAVVLPGPVSAMHDTVYTYRYFGGGAFGGIVKGPDCVAEHDGTKYAIGGACRTPCYGRCLITVTDDVRGTNVRFRFCLDDAPFCAPQLHMHQAIIEANTIAVALLWNDATTGIITIQAV